MDKLSITHADGTVVQVEPVKPSWPCHDGQPCICKGEQMDSTKNVRQNADGTIPFAQAEREAELEDNYKKKKYIALFQARTILSKIGTMPERQLCRKQLKIMKKRGI